MGHDDSIRERDAMVEIDRTSNSWRLVQLLLLGAAAWAVTYARFSLGPLQEVARIDLDLSDNQIALLQGPAMALPMVLGAVPLGLVVDKYSRAPVVMLFVALSLAAIVLNGVTSSVALLVVSRALVGLSLSAVVIAAYSIVADLYGAAQRGRAIMAITMGEVVAAPAAFALGGALLATLGTGNWRTALLWMSIPILVVTLSSFALREPPRTGVVTRNEPMREAWPRFWRYRSLVIPLLLARIMVWIADGGVMVWGAPSFTRTFALPPDRIGAIMATAFMISGVLGPLIGGPLADLCQRAGGPRRTVAAICILACLSVPAAFFIFIPHVTLAAVLLTVFLTLHFIIATMATTVAMVVIPGELRGLYTAVGVTVGALFSIGVAPVVVSGISGALGGAAMIGTALAIVCAATSTIGAVVFASGRRYFPDRVAS